MAIDFDAYMLPFWQGNLVHNETLMFVRGRDGVVKPAPLLYTPERILSVRDYSLQITFVPGVDYRCEEDCIVPLPGGSVPVWEYDDYYPAEPLPGHSFEARDRGRQILYGEGNTFTGKQIAVTYTHKDTWTESIPLAQGDRLPRFQKKLEQGQPIRLLFYGDSITIGCNASAYFEFPMEPFMPIWPDLVTEQLRRKYPAVQMTAENTAVGGTDSVWGLQNAEKSAAALAPDLAILAFGMNDGSRSETDFCENMRSIMETVRRTNPQVEFVLVATTLPNTEATGFLSNQGAYESAMQTAFPEIPVVPMTSVHRYLLSKKRFGDMTGNNINHPNDFLCRVYAHSILRTLTMPTVAKTENV